MRKWIAIGLLGFLPGFFMATKAQDSGLRDVITLKNGNGVLKGFISELIPGQSVTIIPSEAVLKVAQSRIAGESGKNITEGGMETALDVLTLDDGSVLEGKITERALNRWVIIRTGALPPQTCTYPEVFRTGKETADPDADIFKASGVLDVVTMKDGSRATGIMTEQTVGESVKIRTQDSGTLVYAFRDIAVVGREGLDAEKSIFEQSYCLDIVELKDGDTIRGIITRQIPGEEITIMTAGGNEFTHKYADIVKLTKETNPCRGGKEAEAAEEDIRPLAEAEPVVKIKEPEAVGDCFRQMDDNLSVPLEKQGYTRGTRTPSLFLLNGNPASEVRMPLHTDIKLLVRVENNEWPAVEQVFIFRIDVNKGTKKRSIDSRKHSFLSGTEGKAQTIAFEEKKAGAHSLEITFQLTEPGEYAVYVTGSADTFSLFGTDN